MSKGIGMMFRVDMHSHFYGGGLDEFLLTRSARPFLRRGKSGAVMTAMNGEFPFKAEHRDFSASIRQMDAQGLTHRLATFPGALGVDVLPAEDVAAPIRAFNDYLTEAEGKTGGRIIGLAGLPLADMALAAEEMRRVRRELNLAGVILPSGYFASLTALKEIEPVLEAANESGALIMVHPGLKAGEEPPAAPEDHPQYRVSAIRLQSQISDSALTLLIADAAKRWPRIAFQIVNLGGTLPFIFERMEAIARHRNPDEPFPSEGLQTLWYDCASLGPRALEAAVAAFGPSRIFMGSDFPIFSDDPYDTALLPARLPIEEKKMIAGANAMALLEEIRAGEFRH